MSKTLVHIKIRLFVIRVLELYNSFISISVSVQQYFDNHALLKIPIKINIFLLEMKIISFFFILFHCKMYIVYAK